MDEESDGIPRTSIVCFASLALIVMVFMAVAIAFKCCKITPDPPEPKLSPMAPPTNQMPPVKVQYYPLWSNGIQEINGAVKSVSFFAMKRTAALNEWFV